jgi:hypothetical protein
MTTRASQPNGNDGFSGFTIPLGVLLADEFRVSGEQVRQIEVLAFEKVQKARSNINGRPMQVAIIRLGWRFSYAYLQKT